MMDMIKPTPKEVVIESGKHSQFVVEPLETGYGITLGNALRRVLLTDLPGAAIIWVEIDGIADEFTVKDGIKDDTADIVLNLKEIYVKAFNPETFGIKTVTIVKEGPAIVTAADIPETTEFEIINKDQYICTLTEGTLEMKLTLSTGRGYVPGNENKKDRFENKYGYIAIDSLYSPVLNASYKVEPARVGQNINYDKLILDVKTKGTSTPQEVVSLAAKIMVEHLKLFINLVPNMDEVSIMKSQETSTKSTASDLNKSIETLDLSVRPLNCLRRAGINTIGDLVNKTEDDLKVVRNLGQKSLDELKEKLEALGLSFRNQDE